MAKKVLITSALLYANGPLHMGHLAGVYLPADCYSRYRRSIGDDVLFISGSDSYGVAITLAAEISKTTPREHANHFHQVNKALFNRLDISFDHYSTTLSANHAPLVEGFFTDLRDRGFLYNRSVSMLYSSQEQRFMPDRYVRGLCPKCGADDAFADQCNACGELLDSGQLINPRSTISGHPLIVKDTHHWFLKLKEFKDNLSRWLDKKDWKASHISFLRSYLDSLEDRSITRDLDWGVKIPGEDKVFYVWFDAPIGYISATADLSTDLVDQYWLNPKSEYYQFIGKDNLLFHGIVFPAMVMGHHKPYKLVDHLIVSEFFNLEGKKFSKSSGWYIDLDYFLDHYDLDLLRYYLAANAPENRDSEFSWQDFQVSVNADLVGKIGNFIHRTLSFIANHVTIIPPIGELSTIDRAFRSELRTLYDQVLHSYESCSIRRSTQYIIKIALSSNIYFDRKKPWSIEDSIDLNNTIALSLDAVRILSVALSPIIPRSVERVYKMLGLSGSWNDILTSSLVGRSINRPKPLFKKIEDETIEMEIMKLNGNV